MSFTPLKSKKMTDGEILTNTEFDFPFAGKTYKVKKASLKQVIDFQRKVSQITSEKDAAGDLRMAAYAIYLALHAVDTTVTEEYVIENCPGDIDIMDIFSSLGFISRQKVEMMEKLRNSLASKSPLPGENSSAS